MGRLRPQRVPQAAIAFENAQLYDTIRRHASELEQHVAQRTPELEGERSRLQVILDSVGEGITLTDHNWIVQYINPAIERISGYASAEVVGRSTRLWESGRTVPGVGSGAFHLQRDCNPVGWLY